MLKWIYFTIITLLMGQASAEDYGQYVLWGKEVSMNFHAVYEHQNPFENGLYLWEESLAIHKLHVH